MQRSSRHSLRIKIPIALVCGDSLANVSLASGICYDVIHFSTVMFSRPESHNDQNRTCDLLQGRSPWPRIAV